jgi:uncharacterized protein YecE (DUF72 family)
MSRIFAGTSGYAYASWKPDFYPPKFPAKNFLPFYSTRLNSVEINYTFRRLPSQSTVENWIKSTSPEFRFVIKAHQRITHFARLNAVEQFTSEFLKAVAALRESLRLGAYLFQLPPQFRCDLDALGRFLDFLPGDLRYAFEFRHESWFCDPVYELLRKHRAGMCIAESDTLQVPDVITADFAYYRFRKSNYSPPERQEIMLRLKRVLNDGHDVFVFFKHEESPSGALYAEELLRELR